jgi:GGDEF domain-containing protein
MTVSIGATIACDRDAVATVTDRAERALAQSSENGGNRVVLTSA